MSLNIARFNKDNLLDDSDDEFGEILLYLACEEYNQFYLSKQPCRNSAISGHEYVMEVLHDHWNGTHISAHVPIDEQIPYRGRKVDTTQNVMCVCSFDMKFTYVFPGWEESANDAGILLEFATNPDYGFPMPPQGKYYLVDSGYKNMPGFLSPYRGEMYHLGQYTDLNPIGKKKELFNYRHSSLRNVIERYFSVLKARFPIIKKMPSYDLRIQKYIVIACCWIHNFIRTNAEVGVYFDGGEGNSEVQATTLQSMDGTLIDSVEFSISRTHIREMTHVHDEISDHIWRSSRR
ncbi:uncharacterized protein LOC133805787 [Humulus lupulus]|uniref:uncharacterized protein LOC133805787 n=1 Tax=Humulus lupulus TaxID=3486 RepID=UPI002B40C83C|nr:uncharacterized protein LOC133805787 [Humulus lupulus]